MSEHLDDNHLLVEFFDGKRLNKAKSKSQGKPIYDPIEMVKIRIAGDKETVFTGRAHEKGTFVRPSLQEPGYRISYAERFPEEYKAYKNNQQAAVTGVPLSEAPFLNEAQRATLRGYNIQSVEMLANVSPEKLPMGYETVVDQAKAYLDKASGLEVETRLIAQNESLKGELDTMRQMLEEMKAGATKDKTTLAAAEDEPVEEVVTEAGPFRDMNKRDLRAYIKEQTGEHVKGQPSLSTLLGMAKEVAAKVTEGV